MNVEGWRDFEYNIVDDYVCEFIGTNEFEKKKNKTKKKNRNNKQIDKQS
jgi:hypothetical protein